MTITTLDEIDIIKLTLNFHIFLRVITFIENFVRLKFRCECRKFYLLIKYKSILFIC